MRRTIRILVGVLTLTFAASPAQARVIDENFEESFPVEEGVTLHLDQTDGRVIIETWDRDEISVQAVFRMDVRRFGFGEDPQFDVEFDQRGDDVYVIEHRSGGFSVGFHVSEEQEYRYSLKVPAYAALDLECEDGDVEIRGVRGEIELVLDDGGVLLEDCLAPLVVVEAEDGDVDIRGGVGDFDLRLDDGDVKLRDVTAGRLTLRAEDGDVDLELRPTPEVRWQIRTDDGDVTMTVTGALDAEIQLRGDDEDVRFEAAGAVVERREEKAVDLRSGEGRGRVQVESDGGAIRFRLRGVDG